MIEQIKKRLRLPQVFDSLDTVHLQIAFTHISASSSISTEDKDRYGYDNYELLEKQGDRILALIVVMIVSRMTTDVGAISEMESILTRNSSLIDYMNDLDIAQYVQTIGTYSKKVIADVFEAIIGVLYHHLTNLSPGDREYKDPISILTDWFLSLPPIIDKIQTLKNERYLFDSGRTIDYWVKKVLAYTDITTDIREQIIFLHKMGSGSTIPIIAEQLIIHDDYPVNKTLDIYYPDKNYPDVMREIRVRLQDPNQRYRHILIKAYRTLASSVTGRYEKKYRPLIDAILSRSNTEIVGGEFDVNACTPYEY